MLKRLTDIQGRLMLFDPVEVVAIAPSVVDGCSAVRLREQQPGAGGATYSVRGTPEEVAAALGIS